MITKLLDCGSKLYNFYKSDFLKKKEFSFDLYKMIEEAADFSIMFKLNKNIQVLRAKL